MFLEISELRADVKSPQKNRTLFGYYFHQTLYEDFDILGI